MITMNEQAILYEMETAFDRVIERKKSVLRNPKYQYSQTAFSPLMKETTEIYAYYILHPK